MKYGDGPLAGSNLVETMYSNLNQAKYVEDKLLKGCSSQILIGLFLNSVFQLFHKNHLLCTCVLKYEFCDSCRKLLRRET